jgi:hypothetical protein
MSILSTCKVSHPPPLLFPPLGGASVSYVLAALPSVSFRCLRRSLLEQGHSCILRKESRNG